MAEKIEVVKDKAFENVNNHRTGGLSEDAMQGRPTITETCPVKFARIVFDVTDLGKGIRIMRLKADTPMREIKKLFPKHLGMTEDTFMLHFNNRKVDNQTALQLFGNNLEGDNNVIKIVKSIKIKLEGQPFIKEKSKYLNERPNRQFSEIRQKIAAYLKEPRALIGLVYNDQEILNSQTPESLEMGHGDFLKVIKKDKMKIRLWGSIFNTFNQNRYISIDPNTTMTEIKSMISRNVKEDQRKIMLIYKGREPSDQDTPLNLEMSYTDILFANLKIGVSIKMKGPMADIEEFYLLEEPLKGLFQTYTQRYQVENSVGKLGKCFVFRFNGNIVHDEDTAKSLNMVDGDCITVCEEMTKVFRGSVFKRGFEVLTIDSHRKFKDVRIYLSKKIGVDFKQLVFTIGRQRVGDDDTLQSLNICNGATVISVSVEQYIEVHVKYLCLGHKSLTFTSKIRPGLPMKEWKYEISAELGDPVHYLTFMREDSNIADLDTPERIGIQNGNTVTVSSSSIIKIHIQRDKQLLTDYFLHVDQPILALAMRYSQEFRVGMNSVAFKFGDRDIHLFSDSANKIGLLEGGTIQVVKPTQGMTETVEFYVENTSLISMFPVLNEFPLLWDVSIDDQVFLLKYVFKELFVPEIDLSRFLFLHNSKELSNNETLKEVGFIQGDKICIDVREPDEKEVTVFVKRNMKETKSSMGNGHQCGDEEICAFKLDTAKPLSEFIKKVKSRFTCNSKKDNLFLSFNDVMLNKDDLGKTLKFVPFNNCFKCYAFPNLEAFKKHLQTSANYKQNPDERTKDIEKNPKASQMRININKKKKEKNAACKFTDGKEDLTSKNSKVKKDEVGSSKRKNHRTQNRNKIPNKTDIANKGYNGKVGSSQMKKQINNRKEINSKESDKKVNSLIGGSTTDSLKENVQRSNCNIRGDKQSEILDVKTNLRNNVCLICTFINPHGANFCDVCLNDLIVDDQNWQKVGIKKVTVDHTDSPAPSCFPETSFSSETLNKRVDVPSFDRSTKTSAPPPISPPSSSNPLPSYPSVPDRSRKPSYEPQGSAPTSGLRTVTVPSAFTREFLSISASNTAKNVETCGILGGKLAKDSFIISHLVIPKQSGTANTCVMEGEEELWNYQDKEGLLTLGWIHTHPTQTAFLSSVDMHCQYGCQVLLPEAIAIVCSPKYGQTGYFSLTGDGLLEIGRCTQRGFHRHPKGPPLFEEGSHVQLDQIGTVIVKDLRF